MFSFGKTTKIKKSDMILLATTLSWMLGSGISIKSGIAELLKDPSRKMNRAGLTLLSDTLDEGKRLSDAFKENEGVFGKGLWRQMDAAERTGKEAECLTRIASQLQSSSDIAGKVRGALVYPVFIMLVALVAGYYMFTTVVPQMGEMMGEFDVELPALTVAVMGMADALINYKFIILAVMIAAVLGIRWLLSGPLKMKWAKLLTQLPVVGQVVVDMNYSLVYILLNDMIENGAHLTEALRVASTSASNAYIHRELVKAADTMDLEALNLDEALLATNTMPADDKLLLQVGSQTGRTMELLTDLAARRKAAANASVSRLTELMPSVVLTIVSILVAVMVISIYMPMISMATNI